MTTKMLAPAFTGTHELKIAVDMIYTQLTFMCQAWIIFHLIVDILSGVIQSACQ